MKYQVIINAVGEYEMKKWDPPEYELNEYEQYVGNFRCGKIFTVNELRKKLNSTIAELNKVLDWEEKNEYS